MPRNRVEYEEDFYAWTIEQARLLRSGELSSVDVANLAEEIESLGRSDRRAIESRLTVLLMHLLKWRIQSKMRSQSWSGTIREQRQRIEKLLRESPSLRPAIDEVLAGKRRIVAPVECDAHTAGLMALRAVGVEIRAGAFLEAGARISKRRKPFKVCNVCFVKCRIEKSEAIECADLVIGHSGSSVAVIAVQLPRIEAQNVIRHRCVATQAI